MDASESTAESSAIDEHINPGDFAHFDQLLA
jgi:hypothetical protein